MRTRLVICLAIASIAAFAVACGSDKPASPPATETPAISLTETPTQVPTASTPTAEPQNITVAFSEKPRATDPVLNSGELEELAAGNNTFALDLYGQLAESESGNLFMSPYSVSVALAMTYAGAAGETADEMAETLGFSLPPDRLHNAFNALDKLLAERDEHIEADRKFTLDIANSLWGQQGFEFEQPFLDTLAENYGSGLRLLDFATQTEAARLAINGWVEENTNDRIKDLIQEGVLTDDTLIVLANAIFFKAAWAHEFNPLATETGPFTLADGSTVDAEMMHTTASYQVLERDEYSVIEMPYVGNKTSMFVLVPAEGEFESFERSLDANRLNGILNGLERKHVDLQFPKFSFDAKFDLPEQLMALGMRQAFTDSADFSAMRTPPPNLVISEVIHQAFVAVDELGTEAAASTAVIGVPTSGPPPSVPFTVDRPFIFLIGDKETDTILFAGRVMDPTAD